MIRSATEWNVFNYLLRSRRSTYSSYTVIKYEDLVSNPYSQLQKVMGAVGRDVAGVNLRTDASVKLGLSHTASGNPGRFRTGEVGISLDDEWKRAMGVFQRYLVTACTVSGLVRYGYLLPIRLLPFRPSRKNEMNA